MESNGKLKEFQRMSVLIWIAIITSIIILSVLIFVLDESLIFVPVNNAEQINQVMFLIAVALAFAILFFKRSLFIPGKIVDVSPERTLIQKAELALRRLRKNYITVWALGEAICIIGFVNYIFTVDFQQFLVFAVVSLYSVLINIPRIAIAEKCMELIQENE
jgi:hypothetical protein